jgi:molecular chaperone GrpE
MLRALADAENSRKRAERDRREAEQYGGSKLARDLLPVYDNLRRALDAAGEEQRAAASGVIEGVELTLRELLSVFRKHGMTPVAPEVGGPSTRSCTRPCSRPRCPAPRPATSSR